MFTNSSRADKLGLIIGAALLLVAFYLWWTGWAALWALVAACLCVAVFALLIVWAGNQLDDDTSNDSLSDAASEVTGEAKSAAKNAYDRARAAVQTK